MLAKINSCALVGIDGQIVEVEVDISNGLPSFALVGLPDIAVKESKERVYSAIKNNGFAYPMKHITINLAPADLKKEGPAYDLSIAIGILCASEQIHTMDLKNTAFLGELSLNGEIRPVHGVLSMCIELHKNGIHNLILPEKNALEASLIKGLNVLPANHLMDVIKHLNNEKSISPMHSNINSFFYQNNQYSMDLNEVKGQENVKRALEVAAAGAHNLLMIGPPGSGKTMIAQRLPTILPNMTIKESLQVTKIYSIAGLLQHSTPLITQRPFRSPHHTISPVSLVGGGRIPRPGEISLAHLGVLFLDELPEFQRRALEVLRQPLEEKKVTISRVNATLSYPANFMLIASMNPCPCGYYGDADHECSCSSQQIHRYLNKISGPMLDRLDIHIGVKATKYKSLENNVSGESSEQIRKRVNKARFIQLERYKNKNILFNSHLTPKDIEKYCILEKKENELMRKAFESLQLSARAYHKILKLARTIADLEECEKINIYHLSEAIQYRNLDRKF
ncbi:YifB family Mg chelatase-like AAA ATPase [Garciella nitratireducens]|uniref:Magnesium chelatase family protein n=1 Tax=Garciella nitratireducens DSM 15102 TaxID=1121911 RepID=A0A1T4JXL1_9FIRM|nr:YifB family Mg chelatase-like AAA ATPase [Garciella nitratireducens]RBP41148.1 magnesium chelatase family protein [Garciella nitratireducens]SJZ34854.1 magnesium chelatase family protein [Garciella nitratireducens DSM 15102]